MDLKSGFLYLPVLTGSGNVVIRMGREILILSDGLSFTSAKEKGTIGRRLTHPKELTLTIN